MILAGPNVDLVTAVGEDWDYVFEMCKAQAKQRCVPDLLPEMARRHCFVCFIAKDKKTGEKLGVVHSNWLDGHGFTVDLYVGEGNAGHIPECFDLFADFMSEFTDRLYGYIVKGDERMMKLGQLFGFQEQGEADGYVITMREI